MIFESVKKDICEKCKSTADGSNYIQLEDACKAIDYLKSSLATGHFGCNSNGEHERCDSCGMYTSCKLRNTQWFQRSFPPKEISPLDDNWISAKFHDPEVYGKYLVTCKGIDIPQIRMFEGSWDSMLPVIAWQPLPKIYRGCDSAFEEKDDDTYVESQNDLQITGGNE